ncbi:MAG: hypothetical protein HY430_03395 [Candidatus Levybacteria bacterium]|nr:hypothetical protein [Candidatus Levybacteria bacterium]
MRSGEALRMGVLGIVLGAAAAGVSGCGTNDGGSGQGEPTRAPTTSPTETPSASVWQSELFKDAREIDGDVAKIPDPERVTINDIANQIVIQCSEDIHGMPAYVDPATKEKTYYTIMDEDTSCFTGLYDEVQTTESPDFTVLPGDRVGFLANNTAEVDAGLINLVKRECDIDNVIFFPGDPTRVEVSTGNSATCATE